MSNRIQRKSISRSLLLIGVVIVIAILAAAVPWIGHTWPFPENSSNSDQAGAAVDEHGHEGHEHDDEGLSKHPSIELSKNALLNIGFQPVTVQLSPFERATTIPAIIVERPSQTQIHLVTPLTGVVSEINVTDGEAVEPGSPMFQVRLTHEEVVTAQRDYLLTSENLNVVNREVERLTAIGEGVVAGKRVLEQQYEKQKLEAALLANAQALLLHGLTSEQIAEIRKTKRLVQSLTIRAPDHSHPGNGCKDDHLFHVQHLAVSQGEQVEAGQELAVLADHCELFVEGRAFEDDAKVLRDAVREGWNATATLLVGGDESEKVEGLKLLYLSDQIDPESRAFHFYLRLPNEVILDKKSDTGHRFIEWRFKPGQRMELRVPVERWTDRIVLPVDAVVEEGAEAYVYRQSGNHFQRVPVHVEYRDRTSVLIPNDGAVAPGEVVAGRGAYQIHLALKNKAGGGIDPHAGHQH